MTERDNQNIGPIIGTLIVVLALIAVALYVFASHVNKQALLNSENASTTTISTTSADDIKTLKNDLNNAIK